jgi:bifunctional non-homologous end joining protein LigD
MAKLGDYRRKRRPEATNEPFGDDEPQGAAETHAGAYVVHLHDATRRHYDLRLEVSGVLASFAVPHGLSLDPETKHLAVKTEDHPLEYLEFEDVIPEGQYGAGPMIAWDRGRVEYLEGPAEKEVEGGKLHFRLHGLKLHGAFALVKLAKSAKGNEWLLFKKADEHASKERKITEELPRSVLSGLTVEELERKAAIGAALVARALALGAAKASAQTIASLTSAERSPLLSAASGSVAGGGWLYDAELEGVRVAAAKDGDVVTLRTFGAEGAAESIEAFYPEVVRALRALPFSRIVLDGDLVAFDASGHPSLLLLAKRAPRVAKGDVHRATWSTPVVLVASDLLLLGAADVRTLAVEKRRALLSEALPAIGFVRAAPPLEGALDPLLAFCAEHGVGGVVAKKKGSRYDASAVKGKKPAWVFVPSGIAPRSRARVDHDARSVEVALRKVALTNRGKVFWPDDGYTKGDLCDYYASVADTILPYLASRPVILVRYPDGITGKSFFQWNVPPGMPAWVRTIEIHDEHGEQKRGFLVDDASTLLYIANLACIPLHVLAWRTASPEHADFLTIDFDVKQSELRHAITLASTLKELLDVAGLPSFPKTSGQSGLHVLVPLGAAQGFETARALADLLGRLLVERHPDIATMDRIVVRRGAKVYVDTGQTGQGRAIVAPYSVRAAPGATVSTPLDWSEVTKRLDPKRFTMKTVPARVAREGDLMKGLLDAKPDVAAAVGRLAEIVAAR